MENLIVKVIEISKEISSHLYILHDFFSNFYVESVIKLLLGFFLAGIIGAERESLNKPAGFKTHALIGISAVLIVVTSEYIGKTTGADVTRIPAQLLSGIGFIGAGTILTDGFNVKGLTTATSLLLVTCIGLSIGAGFYLGGIICTILAYLILSYSRKIFLAHAHLDSIQFAIHIKNSDQVMQKIEAVFEKYGINISKVNISKPDDFNRKLVKFICKYNTSFGLNKIITDLSDLDNVIEVETDRE